jgi:hypothetical protein
MKNILSIAGISLVLFIVGCTGTEVREATDNLQLKEQEIAAIEDMILRAEEIATNPLIPEATAAQAAESLDQLTEYLNRLEAELPVLQDRIANANLSSGESIGNALIAAGEIGSSFGAILGGPYAPLLVGGSGLLGLIGGFLNGRKKGVDETLDTFENAEVPVTITNDLKAQKEILRKGNKAVAAGVARMVAKQGNG